jgi:hypothetical protein
MKLFKSFLAAVAFVLAAPSAFAQSCTSSTSLGTLSSYATSIGNTFYSPQHFDDCYSFRLGSTSGISGSVNEVDLSIRFDVDVTAVRLFGGTLGSAGRSLTVASNGAFSLGNLAAGLYSLVVSGDVTRESWWWGVNGVGYSGSIAATPSSVAAPVPEPETYAMLAMGLGLVTWVTRRRKGAAV